MTSIKTYQLKVKEVIKETAQAISIVFDNSKDKIQYRSGQFITLNLTIDGQKVKRSYSLSSSAFTESDLIVCVKSVDNGLVSNYLNKNIKAGDIVEIDEPMGHIKVIPENKPRTILLFAAGSGITPIFSIIKTILTKEQHSKVHLFYGCRNRDEIIYQKELEKYQNQFSDRFSLEYVMSQPDDFWVGLNGRINEKLAIHFIKRHAALTAKDCQYYMCGPTGMMDGILKALDLLEIPKNQVFKENFHLKEENSVVDIISAAVSGKSKVKVIDGKKTYEFEVAQNETILSVAQKLGYGLPYSCQAGMCTACMGKCTTGKVRMTEADGLTDNEIKQGYVLTCVGHPDAAEVVIEL
ncbi:MAG: 2Fe-2S iron-sulfur cluster-binding protein [Cytophagales bacterium]